MDKFWIPPAWTHFSCPHMDKFWMPLHGQILDVQGICMQFFWKFWQNNRLPPPGYNQPLENFDLLRILTIFLSYKKPRYRWVPQFPPVKHIKKGALTSQNTHGIKEISVRKGGGPENIQCRSVTGAADPLFCS